MARAIRTPAGGHEVSADIQGNGLYRITSGWGTPTMGWLHPASHGSRRVWGISLDGRDPTGRYVDMAHAVQGLLSARASLAPSPSSDRGGS